MFVHGIVILFLFSLCIAIIIFHYIREEKINRKDTVSLQTYAIYKVLIEKSPVSILVETDERELLLTNQAFCSMFQVPLKPEELVGLNCAQLALKGVSLFQDSYAFLERVEGILQAKALVVNEEVYLTDGRVLERDFIPIVLEHSYFGNIWVYRDITIKKALENKLQFDNKMLRSLAELDGLTGVWNRRAFDNYIEEQLRNQDENTYLFMIDIDFFKKYNDYYGHVEGDRILRIIALQLNSLLKRYNGYLARYGGEEFVGVLNGSHQEAFQVARAIKEEVEALRVSHEKSPFSIVTVSVGAANKKDKETIEQWIKNADEALYEAKRLGRNRYIFFQETL